MSKPGGDPSSGISSVDVLILTERHPACRKREARPGSCMERENLAGDGKGKGASGSNREAESTDAPEREPCIRTSAPITSRADPKASKPNAWSNAWLTLATMWRSRPWPANWPATECPRRGCFFVVRHRLCRPTANETLVSHCRVVGIELRRRGCFFVGCRYECC